MICEQQAERKNEEEDIPVRPKRACGNCGQYGHQRQKCPTLTHGRGASESPAFVSDNESQEDRDSEPEDTALVLEENADDMDSSDDGIVFII